jgi:hypothetical protein
VRLRTDATNDALAPHMGISAICWTAHFQGFSFNDVGTRHSNIIDVAGRLVWSMSTTSNQNTVPSPESVIRQVTRIAAPLDILTGVGGMLDTALLAKIAEQMMASDKVDVDGESVPVSRTSKNRFRTLAFTMGGREYMAIEQNAEKPNRWGQLARGGASGCPNQGQRNQSIRGGGR